MVIRNAWPLYRAVALLIVCLAVLQTAYADPETRDPRAYFFAQSFGDLPEELAEARADGKLGLLLFFEQEGCPYCERMMNTILNRVDVQDWYRERFTSIAVDINGAVELRDVDGVTLPSNAFAAHRRVKTTPVISFIDLEGTEVHRRVAVVTSPEEFLLLGRYVAEGHYTDTAWRDFAGDHIRPEDAPQPIPRVRDFEALGASAAAAGQLVLLAVTREGCPYCGRLRREVLLPMIAGGEYAQRLVIREMMMEPDTAVTDFGGRASSTAALADAWGVTIAPTVLLLDERGNPLGEPIVGINNGEMYGYYLDRAIDEAERVRRERQE